VGDGHPLAHAGQRRGHLHPAARVGGDHELRARGQNRGGLALGELARRLGVEQVVRASAPAADFGLGQLSQLDAGDAAQEPAGLVADALCVRQVARVLVGDRDAQR